MDNPYINAKSAILRLSNFLRGKSRLWMYHEFFYSTIDRQYFLFNEFSMLLKQLNISSTKHTRREWAHIRHKMGAVRRFSAAFIASERRSLAEYRKYTIYTQLNHNTSVTKRNGMSFDKLAPFSIGTTVYALHPIYKYIAKGSILSYSLNSWQLLILFDSLQDGTHLLNIWDVAVNGFPSYIQPQLFEQFYSPIPNSKLFDSSISPDLSNSDYNLMELYGILLERKNILLKELSTLCNSYSIKTSSTYIWLRDNLKTTNESLASLQYPIQSIQIMLKEKPLEEQINELVSLSTNMIDTYEKHYLQEQNINTTNISEEIFTHYTRHKVNSILFTTIIYMIKMSFEIGIRKDKITPLIDVLFAKMILNFPDNIKFFKDVKRVTSQILEELPSSETNNVNSIM
ncbi:hypothetical protein WA158_004762 [Blastocystis sp. Blastoise]